MRFFQHGFCQATVCCCAAADSFRCMAGITLAAVLANEYICPSHCLLAVRFCIAAHSQLTAPASRIYWPDYAALVGLLVILCISETVTPFQRRIYHIGESLGAARLPVSPSLSILNLRTKVDCSSE